MYYKVWRERIPTGFALPLNYLAGQILPPQKQQFQTRQSTLDFVPTRGHFCNQNCDVLLLLNTCHAAGVAIGGGKELIAACTVAAETRGSPDHDSFKTALVQQLLEHAATSTGEYLTGAMLYRNLLQKTLKEELNFQSYIYIYAEFHPSSRKSILLKPQGTSLTCSIPATTWPNNVPVSVVLNVQLGDATERTRDELVTWLTKNKPGCVERIRFRAVWKSNSYTLVFENSCGSLVLFGIVSHAAIGFISFFPRSNTSVMKSPHSCRRQGAPRGGRGHTLNSKSQSFGGYWGSPFPGRENRSPQ